MQPGFSQWGGHTPAPRFFAAGDPNDASKGWKAFRNVHLKHIVPDDALVSTCEIGILMDVICRILYPTAYSVFIASVFVYS